MDTVPDRAPAGAHEFAAWLLAITADQATKARTRQKQHAPIEDVRGSTPATDDGLDIQRALARLTDRQRLAVDCVYFVGLSWAARTRCSSS